MRARTATALAGIGLLLVAVPAAQPQGGTKRANLVTSAAAEPPDFELAGGRFRHSFTVTDQGIAAVTRETVFRVFLSPDAARGNDIELRGTRATRGARRITGLRANGSRTRRITLNIPGTVRPGFYYLIGCADGNNAVRETSEGDNCRVSGQQVGINVQERPTNGAPGAPGPTGADGPPGPDADRRVVGRTTLSIGRSTVDLAQFPAANGMRPAGNTTTPDEGSTQQKDLMKVGPFTFRALCRRTTNGEEEPPDQVGNSSIFDGDGEEAKILVYIDSGTMALNGQTGPRSNIPAGTGTPGADDETGGEGKHQLVVAMRDPTTTQDPAVDEAEWTESFRSFPGFVAHSGGTEVAVHLYAGIDVLGVGDNCVFGGVVTVINGPA
jgi:hypothetical protein